MKFVLGGLIVLLFGLGLVDQENEPLKRYN